MSIVHGTNVVYALRVECPAGGIAEAGGEGYADRSDAEAAAAWLAAELAGGWDPHFGPTSLAGDVLESLGFLRADPLACEVQVVPVEQSAGAGGGLVTGVQGPGVGEPVHRERVRSWAWAAAVPAPVA